MTEPQDGSTQVPATDAPNRVNNPMTPENDAIIDTAFPPTDPKPRPKAMLRDAKHGGEA